MKISIEDLRIALTIMGLIALLTISSVSYRALDGMVGGREYTRVMECQEKSDVATLHRLCLRIHS